MKKFCESLKQQAMKNINFKNKKIEVIQKKEQEGLYENEKSVL